MNISVVEPSSMACDASFIKAVHRANGLGWTVIGAARTDNAGGGIMIAMKARNPTDPGLPQTEYAVWSYRANSPMGYGHYTLDPAGAWGAFYQRHADHNTWIGGKVKAPKLPGEKHD